MAKSKPGKGASKLEQVAGYPLLQALLERRSHRFAKGLQLDNLPLGYKSSYKPQPLSREEEAALAFAACGITGPTLAELPYVPGELPESAGGNILTHFIGRTIPSGDALHSVVMFVINDEGTWLLKRPQDFPTTELAGLIEQARQHKLVELYEKSRVQIADRRVDVPRQTPYMPTFNKWSANQPGTTYFLPVSELSALYINVLLAALSEDLGYFLLDERSNFQPAGLAKFARSKGGHLYDDITKDRVGTIGFSETWMLEFGAFEQGAMLQNLGLMTQALGLGGFAHFAAHTYGWFQALGFRMEDLPFSRTAGAGPVLKILLKLLKRDIPVPTAVGLERAGQVLLKPFCPPYYRNMEEAVLAYVDYKYAPGKGTLRDGCEHGSWQTGAEIQSAIPRCSDKAIEATIAYCDYVYKRYGRFPAISGPFRTVLAYQAHHLDLDFYDKFYKPGAYSTYQKADFKPVI